MNQPADALTAVLNYYTEAVQPIEGLSEPPVQEALYRLGLTHQKRGLKLMAKGFFEQGTTDHNCLNALGKILVDEVSEATPTGAVPEDLQKIRRASELFRAAAGAGNPKAMANLGALLLSGKGIEKSLQEAKIWFNRAAAKQEPDALYYLGYIEHQEAVLDRSPQKYTEANKFYRHALAVNPNHSQANYYLGCLLEAGLGGSKDLVLAVVHFDKALESDQLNHKAMYKLGRIYLSGMGIKQPDQVQGLKLIERSAQLGNAEARTYLQGLQTGTAGLSSIATGHPTGHYHIGTPWSQMGQPVESNQLSRFQKMNRELESDRWRGQVSQAAAYNHFN